MKCLCLNKLKHPFPTLKDYITVSSLDKETKFLEIEGT